MDSEFLSNLAHQLRSPLSSLRVWVDLLKDPSALGSPDDLKKLVDGIERSTSRLERQITDILEAGYIQAGTLTLDTAAVDPLDVVAESIESNEQAAKARQISVGLRTESIGAKAMADRQRFLQIMNALLSNSIKFSPVGSSVTVIIGSSRPDAESADSHLTVIESQQFEGDAVYVTIRDSGPGIDRALHEEVFKPFYRTKRDGAPGGSGAGLGLVIARGLVNLHGGELWVRSATEKGAEFGFTLPAAAERDEG